jgi:hypothetical protein
VRFTIGILSRTRLSPLFQTLCTNLNLTDVEVCHKVFRRDLRQKITLCEDGFGFEPEIATKAARLDGVRIYEVPMSYYGRTYAEGKKIVGDVPLIVEHCEAD